MTKVMVLKEIERLINEGRSLLDVPTQSQSLTESQERYARWQLGCRNVLLMIQYPVAPWTEQFSTPDDDFRARVAEQLTLLNALASSITDELKRSKNGNGHSLG